MGAIFRSWWQQIKQHRASIEVAGIIFVVVIALIILGYRFDWTGFNSGTSQITITSTSKVNYTATVTQPSKSLWDWLGLLAVLAIPVVVGLGAVWFTTRQGEAADAENKDNQRETALQTYIDKMSELLLQEALRKSQPDDEVRMVARIRTLTVLHRLDAARKGNVIQFLAESELVGKIPLDGADLRDATLRWAHLEDARLVLADLKSADLREAYLMGAKLRNADLTGANMSGAHLTGANLTGAKVAQEQLDTTHSLKGATMPDGSKHP